MMPSAEIRDCILFGNLANSPGRDGVSKNNVGGQETFTAQPPLVDPKERKRKRERDRYAQMSKQQRYDRNRKRREAYHREKAKYILINLKQDLSFNCGSEQLELVQNTLPAAAERSSGCIVDSEEIIGSIEIESNVTQGKKYAHGTTRHIDEVEEQKHSRCTLDSVVTLTNDDCATIASLAKNSCSRRTSTEEQIEAKRERNRVQYANMTEEQKQARRDRQNARYKLQRNTLSPEQIQARCERRRVHNMTPEEKQTKRDREKARRVLRCNTLHKESIAMENPMWDGKNQ
ncbi:hypothetical protein EJB05_47811, partial [Eragrostis curvula]